MRKKTVLLVAVLASWPAWGAAQNAPSAERAALDALVREVRLLRQAVERQTASTARSQLMTTRLTLQNERVVRAQDALDRMDEAVAAAIAKRDDLRVALERATAELAPVLHDPRRSELERQVASLKTELTVREGEVERLTEQRGEAEERLAAEQRAYDELEASLDGQERRPAAPAAPARGLE